MSDDLTKELTLKLSSAHLLVVWDVLANKLSKSSFIEELAEEEKRAVWALQDICEEELAKNGFSARKESDWNRLMEASREQVKTIPVESLE